jgi:ADP-ribose pyrophosphatase YjhB (NUDIX family)
MSPADLALIEERARSHKAYRSELDAVMRAAVALVIAPDGDDLAALLIERAQHPLDPWSGHMAFPGGRHDAADPSLERTAIRETLEEVGIDLIRDSRFVAPLDEIRAQARSRDLDMVISPFLFFDRAAGHARRRGRRRAVGACACSATSATRARRTSSRRSARTFPPSCTAARRSGADLPILCGFLDVVADFGIRVRASSNPAGGVAAVEDHVPAGVSVSCPTMKATLAPGRRRAQRALAEPDELHLTVRFISEVDGVLFGDVLAALESPPCPVHACLARRRAFSAARRAAHPVTGLGRSPELTALHNKVEALVRAGSARAAQVPAARDAGPPARTPVRAVGSFIALNGSIARSLRGAGLQLFSSNLSAKRAVHRQEAVYPLQAEVSRRLAGALVQCRRARREHHQAGRGLPARERGARGLSVSAMHHRVGVHQRRRVSLHHDCEDGSSGRAAHRRAVPPTTPARTTPTPISARSWAARSSSRSATAPSTSAHGQIFYGEFDGRRKKRPGQDHRE